MNSSLRSFSLGVNSVICHFFIALIYYAQFIATINFLYRYIGVVCNRSLGRREYMGMLAALMLILAGFYIWEYFLSAPTESNEFVMTKEYIEVFGGPNATAKDELRACIRGDLVFNLLHIT
jgi:hypothetical protein